MLVKLKSKILGLVIAAILLVGGVILWQLNRLVDATDAETGPLVLPKPPAVVVREDSTQRAEKTRVEAPRSAPPTDDSSTAIAAGRVRGMIDFAPGAKVPAQFELVVETAGVPAKHFVFPGTERVVTLDLALGRSVLSAHADGQASRLLVIERANEAALPPFKLVLEPAGQLNGQVLDARGAPLAGLAVALVATNCRDVRTVPSDSDGRYTFSDIPVGAYRVAFGSSDGPIAPVVSMVVSPSEVHEVPPQNMPELGEGEIRVLDRASQPVAGARVFGAGQRGGWVDGVSDGGGYVRARFLPAGTFFLNVTTDDGRTGQGPLEVNMGRVARAVIQIRN